MSAVGQRHAEQLAAHGKPREEIVKYLQMALDLNQPDARFYADLALKPYKPAPPDPEPLALAAKALGGHVKILPPTNYCWEPTPGVWVSEERAFELSQKLAT